MSPFFKVYPEILSRETKENPERQNIQLPRVCSSSTFVLDFLSLGPSSSSHSFVQLDALMLAVGHMQLEILMSLKSYLEIGDVSRRSRGFKYVFIFTPTGGRFPI